MIAVSDHAGELITQNEFYIHQCGSNKPVVLYQDNQSTIRLLKNGKSSSDRTIHINIRYFWLKDRVDSKDVLVEYMPTGDTLAELLTRPVPGDLFIKLRRFLMNLRNKLANAKECDGILRFRQSLIANCPDVFIYISSQNG